MGHTSRRIEDRGAESYWNCGGGALTQMVSGRKILAYCLEIVLVIIW